MSNPSCLRRSTLAAALVVMCWPRAAQAADPQAEALYQEGRRAAEAKDWPLACKKFKESQDREPAPGTLLNLADCEENRSKLVDAATHFRTAAQTFKPNDPRVTYAKERAASLDQRTPRLTVRLQRFPSGTNVECDGVALDAKRIGAPMLIDPGEHVVVARAPGRVEVRKTIQIGPSESREIDLVAEMPPPAPPPPPVQLATSSDVRPPPVTSLSTLRTVGIISLGVGAAGLGIGILGGVMTMNAKSTVDAECSAGCSPSGLEAQSDGRTWSAVGTAGFIVAGAGLLAGGGLLLFAPSKTSTGSVRAVPALGGSEIRWVGEF